MAAVGQIDNCILSVLAHITALDLGSGVIWGKEFISDVSFIVLPGSCNRWRRISLVIHANVCVGSKAVQLDA